MKKNKKLFIEKIIKAIRKEPWGITLISLIWTAGPATYICLQIGYYIGYGKFASLELTIYFLIFTLISGLISISTRISYSITKGHVIEKAEYDFKTLIQKLPNFFIIAKNLRFTECKTKKERNLLSSKNILENPDATEDAIKTAIYNLCDDEELSNFAKMVEIYRENGLYYLIDQNYSKFSKQIDKYYNSINKTAPETAKLFIDRLQGIVPSKNHGLTRKKNFLNNLIENGISYNFNKMSFGDVYEMILLTLELLHDRRIPYYKIIYEGNSDLIKRNKLLRLDYKQYLNSTRKINKIILTLINILEENLHHTYIFPFLTNFSSQNIIDEISYALDHIDNKTTRRKATKLYNKLILEQQICNKKLNIFLQKKEDLGQSQPLSFYHKKYNVNGIRLSKRFLFLSSTPKLQILSQLSELIHYIKISKYTQRMINSYSKQIINPIELKFIAYKIFLILDKYINLRDPNIINAIIHSRATNFLGLDTSYTTEVKSRWLLALAKEMNYNSTHPPGTDYLSTIISDYNITLDEQNKDILKNTYNIKNFD